MAKSPKAAEPEAPQMQYSFMSLIKKSGAPPAKVGGKATDPFAVAKDAIVKALDEQTRYLGLVESGQPLPKTKGGTNQVSTWFTSTPEGYWTGIRYGQLPIPLNGATGHFIGTADELTAFYAALKEAITKGELDEPIRTLQQSRSDALKGRGRTTRQAA